MEQSHTLDSFSLETLVMEANKVNREHRFAATLFIGIGLAVTLLGAFLLFTGGVPVTAPKLVELIGIPVLYFYVGFLYFRALEKDAQVDWTLAVRLRNEKARIARQVDLYRKLPTRFLLPVTLITSVSFLPGLFDDSGRELSLPGILIHIATVIFIISAALWGLKRAEKTKLRPLLDKLEKLESQLNEGQGDIDPGQAG